MLYPVQEMSSVVAYVHIKDTATVNKYLNMPEITDLRGKYGLEYAGFYWGNKPTRFDKTLMELYAIRSNRQGVPPLSGDVINDAYQSYDEHSQPAVSMSMDATGASIWAKMTRRGKTILRVIIS